MTNREPNDPGGDADKYNDGHNDERGSMPERDPDEDYRSHTEYLWGLNDRPHTQLPLDEIVRLTPAHLKVLGNSLMKGELFDVLGERLLCYAEDWEHEKLRLEDEIDELRRELQLTGSTRANTLLDEVNWKRG